MTSEMHNGTAGSYLSPENGDKRKAGGLTSGFALLPNAPAQICFDKSEFMRDDYKVEQFVADGSFNS